MTDSLIEAVAKAIYESDATDSTVPWEQLSELARRDGYMNAKMLRTQMLTAARAVMAAITETGFDVVPSGGEIA